MPLVISARLYVLEEYVCQRFRVVSGASSKVEKDDVVRGGTYAQ